MSDFFTDLKIERAITADLRAQVERLTRERDEAFRRGAEAQREACAEQFLNQRTELVRIIRATPLVTEVKP